MGGLALLPAHPSEALVPSLRAALQSPDPGLRAVAARLVGIRRMPDLLTDSTAALDREQDPYVGAELMRAALFYGTLESSAAANRYVPRGGKGALGVYAEALARTAPSRFVAELPDLAARFRTLDNPNLASIVAMSADQYPANRASAVHAWLSVATSLEWRSLLATLGPPTTPEDGATILEALSSPNSEIRQETVWQVAGWLAKSVGLPPTIVTGASGAPPSTDEPATWEAFGREVVFRLSTGAQSTNRAAYISRQGAAHPADLRVIGGLPKGLKAEEQAADGVFKSISEMSLPDSGSTVMTTTRGFDVPWPGFLASLFAAVHCKPTSAPAAGLVTVAYRPDGRPESAANDLGSLPPECAPAVEALVGLITIEPHASVKNSARQRVLLFGQRDVIARADAISRDDPGLRTRGPEVGAGPIVEPKKTTNVRPIYPASAQRDVVQGLVVLESVITKAGCVRSMSVVRSVRFDLDLAAMLAVSQWKYSPATLGGTPVEVSFAPTVNFALN